MNIAPARVMNGLSHVCGAKASAAVNSGGKAHMASAYCAGENKPRGRYIGATAASAVK